MPTPAQSSVPGTSPGSDGLFPATMWSQILATPGDDDDTMAAMEHLARGYWRPLYVFARQRGSTHEAAADAVQGFFEHLLTREVLRSIERRETRFRSWLLACFKNWVGRQHRHDRAARRGAGAEVVPLHEMQSMLAEPHVAPDGDAERIFDRRWARAVFDRALARLDEEIAQRDRRDFFEALRGRVFGSGANGQDWEAFAERTGTTAGAARKAAHDLRQRFAMLLRAEVRSIVGSDADVDEELRYLAGLLAEDS